MTPTITWYVGFDWARERHWVCVLDAAGAARAERAVEHGGAGLGALCDWLLATTRASPGEIAVAIETPHGPVVELLLERGFAVYAINPKQLDRFRDRFSPAGAKDDRRDALVLGASLRSDRHAFRRVALDQPLIIELREHSRLAGDLQRERTRLANRVREQLWRYYPQALQLSRDVAADWFLALWRHAPTPERAARLRAASFERILRAHRIRCLDGARALAILRQQPLTLAPGTSAAACAHIELLAARLRLINAQLAATQRRIDELCAAFAEPGERAPGQAGEQRDVAILRSLPGVGRINLATLLAEAGQPLQRRDYHALRTLSGVAPVTRRSGKSCQVVRRLARNRRLEQAVYHWARTAAQHDPYMRRRYGELRARGHSHGRALRTLGDRLLALSCTLLRRQVLFDPHYKPLAAAA